MYACSQRGPPKQNNPRNSHSPLTCSHMYSHTQSQSQSQSHTVTVTVTHRHTQSQSVTHSHSHSHTQMNTTMDASMYAMHNRHYYVLLWPFGLSPITAQPGLASSPFPGVTHFRAPRSNCCSFTVDLYSSNMPTTACEMEKCAFS